jgi:MFS family permease
MPTAVKRDLIRLYVARSLRMFGYGCVSVALVVYLTAIGFSGLQVGLLLTATLVGDAIVSLWLTTHADRFGRRRTLTVGAVLMVGAGLAFALTTNYFLLLCAATVGVISPSGTEVGPFLAVEQSSLAHIVDPDRRTTAFAWYQLCGSFATAFGAVTGGFIAQVGIDAGGQPADGYRLALSLYPIVGLLIGLVLGGTSRSIEVAPESIVAAGRLGIRESRRIVTSLSLLLGLDALAGGFVLQSLVVLWFQRRFGADPEQLGLILFWANLAGGLSALVAGPLAGRLGPIRAMVFSHIPANVLLIALPLMPSLPVAAGVVFLRYGIGQIDVPTRQAYVIALVPPSERSAAAGITGIARSLGVAVSPLIATPLYLSVGLVSSPFFIAGALKITYDLLLYRRFRHVQPWPAIVETLNDV